MLIKQPHLHFSRRVILTTFLLSDAIGTPLFEFRHNGRDAEKTGEFLEYRGALCDVHAGTLSQDEEGNFSRSSGFDIYSIRRAFDPEAGRHRPNMLVHEAVNVPLGAARQFMHAHFMACKNQVARNKGQKNGIALTNVLPPLHSYTALVEANYEDAPVLAPLPGEAVRSNLKSWTL